MTVWLAIDPGTTHSGWVVYDSDQRHVERCGKDTANEELLMMLPRFDGDVFYLAIEMIASYGMPVGREVFETCVWIGRFQQAWPGEIRMVYRRDVKLHLCGTARAKDPHVRQALVDLHGGSDKAAKGTKAAPGPLYGVSSHAWSALAVAVTASQTQTWENAA